MKHTTNTQGLKLFKILELQKELQSSLRRNKSFMNGFLIGVLHRKKKNTKIISIFSKQLKRKERKYATPANYLNALKILKKHEIL